MDRANWRHRIRILVLTDLSKDMIISLIFVGSNPAWEQIKALALYEKFHIALFCFTCFIIIIPLLCFNVYKI